MSEWWTYSLSDLLLFSPRTYRHLIALYNEQAWPLHALMLALGAVVAGLAAGQPGGRAWGAAFGLLAVGWAWVGFDFLGRHYASINWAAIDFGIAFGVQALLLVIAAARRFVPVKERGAAGGIGAGLMVFALVVQPLVGPALGRPLNEAEVFGLLPDPTVALSLGVLSLAPRARFGAALWVIPLLWCGVSAATLATMHDADALVMPLVACVALAVAVRRRLR
jgi:hypothetical protein